MGAPVPAVDMIDICQQNDIPPPSHNVEDCVPAEPEYPPVDYLKAKCPALGTSQTPATQPASNTAFLSSDITAAQLSEGGFSVKRKVVDTSHDERATHDGLQGRATNVVPVTSEALPKKYPNIQDGMVAKIFWGEASRTTEPKILNKVAKVYDSVKGHIPELWNQTFTNPTSTIRESLGVPEPTTRSRVVYIIIFNKLYPITKLHGKELFDAWYQCIQCHIALWKEGVYHRNVIPPNMTWYEIDRKLTSVLIDYDVSSLAEPGPRGNERTDTVPFLALDMLTAEGQRGEVKHLYRHDLESFIWCFAWISLRYKNGVLLPRGSRPFDEWAQLEARKCCTEKNYFLAYPQTPKHSHIYPLLWSLILDCLDLLYTDFFYRRQRQYLLSKERGETPTDTEETESDIDSLLQRFKDTESWVALSKPSREPSL